MKKAVSKVVSNFGTKPCADRRQDLVGSKSAGKAAIGLDFKKAGSGLSADPVGSDAIICLALHAAGSRPKL